MYQLEAWLFGTNLSTDFLLIFLGKADEMVIFRTYEKWNSSLVESSSLSIPLLDTVQRTLPCQVKHEQYRDRIIADQGQHVDEFPLSTKIPDRECYLSITD